MAAALALAAPPPALAGFVIAPAQEAAPGLPVYQLAYPPRKPAVLPDPAVLDGVRERALLADVARTRPAVDAPAAKLAGAAQGADEAPKTVLPEPATIAVLGIGLVSLAFLRRAGV